MKLAIRKEPGFIPGSGFHYMLHPLPMKSNTEAALFQMTGHIVIEVSEDDGNRLIAQGTSALNHQIEIAILTDAVEKEINHQNECGAI